MNNNLWHLPENSIEEPDEDGWTHHYTVDKPMTEMERLNLHFLLWELYGFEYWVTSESAKRGYSPLYENQFTLSQ